MPEATSSLSEIPFLGSGIGFRRELKKRLFELHEEVDFVEIITDQYREDPRAMEELEEVCGYFQIIPHGVSLSVGSAGPLDREYLRFIKSISDLTKAPYYSEHLCMTRAPGIDIGHLSPLWFTEDILRNTIDKVNQIQDYLGKPLILENVTYSFEIPNAPMSQTEFFNRMVDATGCGVLLDVTNVYINSVNHGFDPDKFLDEMPMDRVVQLHLAGGYWSNGFLIDSHSEVIQDGSWEILEKVAAKANPKGSILEHDRNFPEIEELLASLQKARDILGWTKRQERSYEAQAPQETKPILASIAQAG